MGASPWSPSASRPGPRPRRRLVLAPAENKRRKKSNSADVVDVDRACLLRGCRGYSQAFARELQHAHVHALASLVADHKKGGLRDAQLRTEHHPRTCGVALIRPHDLVDTLQKSARSQISRRLL